MEELFKNNFVFNQNDDDTLGEEEPKEEGISEAEESEDLSEDEESLSEDEEFYSTEEEL